MIETDLITNYFEVQIALGHMGVIWFGASIPICGIIIKYTLEYKIANKELPFKIILVGLISGFFIALIIYGLFSAYYLGQLSQGILGLLPLDIIARGNAIVILEQVTYFYLFPSLTFLLIFVAWCWILHKKIK